MKGWTRREACLHPFLAHPHAVVTHARTSNTAFSFACFKPAPLVKPRRPSPPHLSTPLWPPCTRVGTSLGCMPTAGVSELF